MSNPIITIHNTETHEITERVMTDDEVLTLNPSILTDGDQL